MTDRQYARKRPGLAWHVVDFHTRGLNTWKTVCGRPAVDPVVDVLPWDDTPCKACLKIFVREVDPAAPIDDDGSTWPESVP